MAAGAGGDGCDRLVGGRAGSVRLVVVWGVSPHCFTPPSQLRHHGGQRLPDESLGSPNWRDCSMSIALPRVANEKKAITVTVAEMRLPRIAPGIMNPPTVDMNLFSCSHRWLCVTCFMPLRINNLNTQTAKRPYSSFHNGVAGPWINVSPVSFSSLKNRRTTLCVAAILRS